MYLEDLDDVIVWRNHRQKYIDLRKGAESGSMGDLTIFHEGNKLNVWSIISADAVRVAIAKECDRLIAEKDKELGALGVNVAPKLRRAG